MCKPGFPVNSLIMPVAVILICKCLLIIKHLKFFLFYSAFFICF